MAFITFWRVSSDTRAGSANTRETVILETPASFETSLMVAFFDVTNAAAKGVRSTKACLPSYNQAE
jgi:hypothetical protein